MFKEMIENLGALATLAGRIEPAHPEGGDVDDLVDAIGAARNDLELAYMMDLYEVRIEPEYQTVYKWGSGSSAWDRTPVFAVINCKDWEVLRAACLTLSVSHGGRSVNCKEMFGDRQFTASTLVP